MCLFSHVFIIEKRPCFSHVWLSKFYMTAHPCLFACCLCGYQSCAMPGEVAVAGHVPTFTPSGALQIAQTANVCFKLDALLEAC